MLSLGDEGDLWAQAGAEASTREEPLQGRSGQGLHPATGRLTEVAALQGRAAAFHSRKHSLLMETQLKARASWGVRGASRAEDGEWELEVLWQARASVVSQRKGLLSRCHCGGWLSFHILPGNSCDNTDTVFTRSLRDSVSSFRSFCYCFICPTSQSSKVLIEWMNKRPNG